MSDGRFLIEVVADSYRSAALAGANMRRATESLEAVRGGSPDRSFLDTWSVVDNQIGLTDDKPLLAVLVELRRRLLDEGMAGELTRLHNAFGTDPTAGWARWLHVYTEALVEWRWPLMTAVVMGDFPFPDSTAVDLGRVRRWHCLARQDRWPEAQGLLTFLGAQETLPPNLRAEVHVFSAQVELFHLLRPVEAGDLLDTAENLSPGCFWVAAGQVECLLQKGETDAARERCRRLQEQHPSKANSFRLMGEICERDPDLEAAEHWFLEAIRTEPGDTSGHLALLRLYGRTEWFPLYEARLRPLLERIVAVDPESTYNAYLEMGLIYDQNSRPEESREWFDRAVALEASRPRAYIERGYAALDQGRFEHAEAQFRTATEVAPEAFDGYWGMAWLFESRELWDPALSWYERSLERRPIWINRVRLRTGEIHRIKGDLDLAEQDLLAALRAGPADVTVQSALQEVSNQRLLSGSTDDAIRLLGLIREIVADEAYEPTYLNSVGNIHYYVGDFSAAIDCYSRAIELSPDDVVFHANLAGAWERRFQRGEREHELANAIAEFGRAHTLRPEESEYGARVRALETERQLLALFGDSYQGLAPSATPIQVSIADDLLPLVVPEGSDDLLPELVRAVDAMRSRVRKRYGVPIPGIAFEYLQTSDQIGAYDIRLMGVVLRRSRVHREARFLDGSLAPLVDRGIPGVIEDQALPGAWIEAEYWPAAQDAGLSLWDPIDYILRHLESIVELHLADFLGHQEVSSLLEGTPWATHIGTGKVTALVRVLKALVDEQVPIAHIDPIAKSFFECDQRGIGCVEAVEIVRSLPEVRGRLAGAGDGYSHLRFPKALEAQMLGAVSDVGGQMVMALRRRRYHDAMVAIRRGVRTPGLRAALLVENPTLRPFVRAMVRADFPALPVLTAAELGSQTLDDFPEIAWSE